MSAMSTGDAADASRHRAEHQVFVHWIPSFHRFPETALRDVTKRTPYNFFRVDGSGLLLQGDMAVAGLMSTVSLEASGLFTVITQPYEKLSEPMKQRFGQHSLTIYREMSRTLHIHMFGHRLSFFPINAPYEQLPSRTTIITELSHYYFDEIRALQGKFEHARRLFVNTVLKVTQGLRSWWRVLIPGLGTGLDGGRLLYIGVFMHLLERRVALASVARALYDCQGAQEFYEAYCKLTGAENLSEATQQRYREAHNLLLQLYRDYADLIGNYVLQSSALFLAVLGVIATVVTAGLALIPDDYAIPYRPTIFLFLALVSYLGVYFLAVKRVADRVLEATKALLEPGTT